MRTKVLDLRSACDHGDYARFRALLEGERRRLQGRARRRVPGAEVDECVETALELAFRRLPARRLRLSLARWLDRLLEEAVRTRPGVAESTEDLAHTA